MLWWTNYLRPVIKRDNFSLQEKHTILELHNLLGNMAFFASKPLTPLSLAHDHYIILSFQIKKTKTHDHFGF
ncbi:unnamed protein product [Linum tenue]|uniref:Uncharacterized protein n=1 Tax=Linum tenue TaxID=586396 RepID=A0AAV0K5T6_9ROSI|nr:unnamed protein product [Linum tenue]